MSKKEDPIKHRERSLKRYAKQRDHILDVSRRWHQAIRLEALVHYGGSPPHCTCCGEYRLQFLCIDHINGGGNKHRKSTERVAARWLRRNGYPEGFQVLCHNCNMAKGFYGKCPHEDEAAQSEQWTQEAFL